jgi:hypothetical protein
LWNYTSSPPIHLQGGDKDISAFTFISDFKINFMHFAHKRFSNDCYVPTKKHSLFSYKIFTLFLSTIFTILTLLLCTIFTALFLSSICNLFTARYELTLNKTELIHGL